MLVFLERTEPFPVTPLFALTLLRMLAQSQGETLSLPTHLLSFVGGVIVAAVGMLAAIFAKGNAVGRWQGTVDTEITSLKERLKRLEDRNDHCDGKDES